MSLNNSTRRTLRPLIGQGRADALERVSRCVVAGALILLAFTVTHAAIPGAGKPYARPEAALVRIIVVPPLRWPPPLAREFVKMIPNRIIEPLGSQTPKTIQYFMKRAAIPKAGLQNEYFCWASSGVGGGYAAIIRRDRAKYSTVWDSLIPPSFIVPRVEFMDVDGDSTAEIICSGQILDSGECEWVIVRWDGTTGHLLAPRLDFPARNVLYNRLIGRSLEFADTPGSPAKTLILTLGVTPGDSTAVSDSTRVTREFRYDKTVDGFFPTP